MQTQTKQTAFRVIFKDSTQRQAFKALCVSNGKSMNDTMLSLIADYLDEK